MRQFKLIVFLLLVSSFGRLAWAQTQAPAKVLFVGNSYTYFWNLPQTVAAMATEKTIDMKTWQSTAGGATWAQHWRGEKDLTSVEKIKQGNYDAVVLQNHSRSAIDRPDSLMHYGKLLAELIDGIDAEIYLYMTWAREWDPYMQETITAQYEALAQTINAHVVPVGLAWQRARELRPGFPLYDPDGSHPSPLGTYLSACVFYGVLTGQSPIGLPNRLTTTDIQGEKLYLTIQSAEDALFCQKVAAEIIANH